ncbi:hypothetical protein WP3W18E01_17250 [Raoultella ornithinolytica]|nr:hypothetical protein WP3W18E01_17250 [Raoultella ornithinolytica]
MILRYLRGALRPALFDIGPTNQMKVSLRLGIHFLKRTPLINLARILSLLTFMINISLSHQQMMPGLCIVPNVLLL